MAGEGLKFQEDFKKSADSAKDVSIDRFYVPRGHAGVHAICDFVLYSHPHEFYMELKAHKGVSIPFDVISDGQWEGLLNKSTIPGVFAGVLFQFYEHSEHWWVDIQFLEDWRKAGLKSVHIGTAQAAGVPLTGERPRSRWRFDVPRMLYLIANPGGASG